MLIEEQINNLDVCVPISAAWPVYKESNSQQRKQKELYKNTINASYNIHKQKINI